MKTQLFQWIFAAFALVATPYVQAAPAPGLDAQQDTLTTVDAYVMDEGIYDSSLEQKIGKLLESPMFRRTQVGICIYDLTDQKPLYSFNPRQCMRPASTEKVITAVTALHVLGPSYQMTTRLYTDSQKKVYVRGGFDPLFDEKDMNAFVQALKKAGIRQISSSIVLDKSFKDNKEFGWGWCWDDKNTPLTPLLYKNKDRFAENFRAALHKAGIRWKGSFRDGKVPAKAKVLCTRTHGLVEVMEPMMKESNNSMAESVFYQIGAQGKAPSTRRLCAEPVRTLIKEMGLHPGDYQVADGSGLSLYNYTTPELLTAMLRFAYDHDEVYKYLLYTLPIAAEDGTLEHRMAKTAAAGNVQAKTGTVEGISTLAGYCTAKNGNRLCFAIMNQGLRRMSDGRDFQDEVCKILCE